MNIDDKDNLSQLPVDVFLQQITRLPYESVIAVCSANVKLRSYCSSQYSNQWKALIDNAFSSQDNYSQTVKNIQEKLHLTEKEYNYLVYIHLLINLLDPITQLMIYYRQKDKKFWNDPRFIQRERFLALFLLNKRTEIIDYLPHDIYWPFIDMMDGKPVSQDELDWMLIEMALRGNMKGLLLMQEKGGNIHAQNDEALDSASALGHLNIVKYLIEQGNHKKPRAGNINRALVSASNGGHLAIVKYLVEQGADVHFGRNRALLWASASRRLAVVDYLKSLP